MKNIHEELLNFWPFHPAFRSTSVFDSSWEIAIKYLYSIKLELSSRSHSHVRLSNSLARRWGEGGSDGASSPATDSEKVNPYSYLVPWALSSHPVSAPIYLLYLPIGRSHRLDISFTGSKFRQTKTPPDRLFKKQIVSVLSVEVFFSSLIVLVSPHHSFCPKDL